MSELLHPDITADVPMISVYIILQACKNECKDISVQTQPDLHGEKLKAMLLERDYKIKELETEKENEGSTLKCQLEVRNISMYEVCFTLTSMEVMCLFYCTYGLSKKYTTICYPTK
jgi:hypothetical protein